MNRLINSSSINFLGLLLFSIFIFSCNTIHQEEKIVTKTERFFQKLPLQKPDSSIQLIKDSIKDKNALKNIDKKLLRALYFNWSPRIVPTYLHYLEPKFSMEGGDEQGFYEVMKGKYYYGIGKIDSSLLFLKSGVALLKKGKDTARTCLGLMELGRFYVMQDYTLLGTETILTALKYEIKKDTLDINTYLKEVLLASYIKGKKWKLAKTLALQELAMAKLAGRTDNISSLYGSLAATFFCLQQKDSSLWAMQKYEENYYKHDEEKMVFGSLNLGLCWKSAGQFDKALQYLLKAKQKSDSLGVKPVSLMANVGLGNTYLARNEFDKAEKYYLELFSNENFKKNTGLLRNISDSMVVLKLKKSNDYVNLTHFYKARQLTDTLTTRENSLIWSEMSVRYESAEKEKQIQSLAHEKNVYKLQMLIILLVLLIVLGIGAWYSFQNRQKQQQLAKENALLAANKELLEIKHQLQEQEINASKEQLVNFRENLSSKAQLIEKMEQQINSLIENASCIANEEIIQSREKLNEMKILTDKDWRTYLVYIEKVYPNLIQKIKYNYADLTEGELRLFVLLYLNFSTAEISNILGISISSVHKNRHRLRKKLALAEEVSLEDFIKNRFS